MGKKAVAIYPAILSFIRVFIFIKLLLHPFSKQPSLMRRSVLKLD